MKIWLIVLLLIVPPLARGEPASEAEPEDAVAGWKAAAPKDPTQPPANWVDSSYAYAAEQAQNLTNWMDNFFGDPNYDLEQAESLVRLEWRNTWDQEEDHSDNLRLRGKLQLPRISRRLNLVFSEDEGDEPLDTEDRQNDLDDRVGLLYEVTEGKHARIDLTMGISSDSLRPGVRFRYKDSLGKLANFRYTQRLQYETDEGFYTTGQIRLNRALGENRIARWNNRAVWGEETDGVEWLTRISMFQRRPSPDRKRELGINYYGSINGFTDPSYVKNYRLGVLFRRQIYRKFLFLELEPAYNYRKPDSDEKRETAWSVTVWLEIALTRDLLPAKSTPKDEEYVSDGTESVGEQVR